MMKRKRMYATRGSVLLVYEITWELPQTHDLKAAWSWSIA